MIQIVESISSNGNARPSDPAFYFLGETYDRNETEEYRRFLATCALGSYEAGNLEKADTSQLVVELSTQYSDQPISERMRQPLAEVAMSAKSLSERRIEGLIAAASQCRLSTEDAINEIRQLVKMQDRLEDPYSVEWIDKNGIVGDLTTEGTIIPRKYDISKLSEMLGDQSIEVAVARELGDRVDGFVWEKQMHQEKTFQVPEISGEHTQLVTSDKTSETIPVVTVLDK